MTRQARAKGTGRSRPRLVHPNAGRKATSALITVALTFGSFVSAGVIATVNASVATAAGIAVDTSPSWQVSWPNRSTAALGSPLSIDTAALYSSGEGWVGKYSNDVGGSVANAAYTKVVSSATGGGGFVGTSLTTMAIDGGSGGRPKTAYFWHWGDANPATSAAIGQALPVPATSTISVWAVPDGQQAMSKVLLVPRPDSAAYAYWSGGEVDQNTGRIYFSGGQDSALEGVNNYARMMILDPATGNYNLSGRIQAATDADRLTGGSGYISSDMMIDAAGNAYVLAFVAGTPTPTGGTADTLWLMKITPGAPGAWTYSRVMPLWTVSGGVYSGLGLGAVWGMAFLNGNLYFTRNAISGTNLYQANPLTGIVTQLSGTGASIIFDLGSAQSAPVLNGTVYDDANANGVKDSGESGVANQIVQIYNSGGTVIGQQTTNASGQYSLLLPSTNATFYARLVQPRVNGANAVQTWGAGSTQNGANLVTQMSRGAVGTGAASAPYVDPAPRAVGGTVALATIAAYARVVTTTAIDVSTADFGISSTGSYGDAPSSYRSTISQFGPQLVAGTSTPSVYLGERAGTWPDGNNANTHNSDDGVKLTLSNGSLPIERRVLTSGKNYPLTYQISGLSGTQAYANAWLAPTNSGSTGSFPATATAGNTGRAGTNLTVAVPVASTVPSGGLSSTWLRASAATGSLTSPNNLNGAYAPAAASNASDTQAWTTVGEVEDYQVFVASAQVRLALTGGANGDYTYALSNITSTSPSTTTATISRTSGSAATVLSPSSHALAAVGSAVVVTANSTPAGSRLASARLVDSLTGAVAGTATVSGSQVTIPGSALALGSDVTLELTYASEPSLANSTFVLEQNPAVADGSDAVLAKVTIADKDNHPLTGQAVTVTATGSNSGQVEIGNLTSGGDGTYTARLTSSVADTYQIRATVVIDGSAAEVGGPLEASFTASDLDTGNSGYAVGSASATANASSQVPITAQLRDANGNAVSLPAGELANLVASAAPGSDLGTGSISAFTETSTKGTYAASVTSSSAGRKTILVEINGSALANSGNRIATFVAGDPDLTHPDSGFVVSDAPVTADGVSAVTATVTLADAHGNRVLGQAGNLTALANPSAGVSLGTFSEVSDGRYQAAITSTWVGATTISVSHDDEAVPSRGNRLATFTRVPVDNQGSRFEVSTDPVRANGSDHATITVLLRNTLDAVATGWAARLSATSDPGDAVNISAFTEDEATPGRYTATVSSTKAGEKVIAVSLSNDSGTTHTLAATDEKKVATFEADDPSLARSSVTIDDANPRVADGSQSHLVTVALADANGNPVKGKTGQLDFSGPSGVSFGNVEETNGVYEVPVFSTNAGNLQITARFDGTTTLTIGTVTAVFVAGAPDLTATGNSTLEATAGNRTANGSAAHTITALLADAHENPISGREVVFELPSGLASADGDPPTATTNSSGIANLDVVSTRAGRYDVRATVSGSLIQNGSPASVTFVAGSPAFGEDSTEISASGGSVEADGSHTHSVSVTVRDAHQNLVEDASVTFAELPAGLELASGSSLSGSTGADGRYSILVTSSLADIYEVTASVGGTNVTEGSPARVEFSVGAASAASSSWTVSPSGSQAAGSVFTAEATVRDTSGNNEVSGAVVSFSFPAQVSGNRNCTTGAGGTCSVSLTSSIAGSYEVSAAIGADRIGSPHQIVFTAGSPQLTESGNSTLSIVNASGIPADGSAAHTIVATLQDAYRNPVAGTPVVFDLPADVSVPGGGSTTVTTNASGVAELEVVSEKVGEYSVTAAVGSDPIRNGSPALARFVAGAPNLARSSFEVSPAGPLPVGTGAGSTYTAEITVVDVNDNPVSGVGVVLDSTLSTSPEILVGITDEDGKFSGNFHSTVAGTAELNGHVVVDARQRTVAGDPIFRTWLAGEPAVGQGSFSTVSGTGGTRIANQTSAHTLTAFVADAYENPVEGQEVQVRLPAHLWVEGGSPTTTDTMALLTTDASGMARANLVSDLVGTYQVTAAVNNTDIHHGSPVSLEYIVGAASAATSVLTLTNSSAHNPPIANGSDTYTATVRVLDASGLNPVEGTAVSFGVRGGARASSLLAFADAAGNASVTISSTVAGGHLVSATIGILEVQDSPLSAVFAAGEVAAQNSDFAVEAAPKTADGLAAAEILVHLADAFGNPVTLTDAERASLVAQTLDNLGAGQFTGFASGPPGTYLASVTSTSAGIKTIRVTYGQSAIAVAADGTDAATFVAGPPHLANADNSSYLVSTEVVPADLTGSASITLRLADVFGNPVSLSDTERAKLVAVAGGGLGTGTISAFTETTNGTYLATITSTVPGNKPITVSYDADSVLPASGANTTAVFTAGAVSASHSTFTVSTGGAQVGTEAGAGHTVTAQLRDGYDNPVTLSPVEVGYLVAATSGALGTGTIAGFVGSNGVYTARVTSTLVGPKPITVSFRDQALPLSDPGNATASFTAGPVSLSESFYSVSGGEKVVGSGVHLVTVSLEDQYGNDVPGMNLADLAASADPSDGVAISGFTDRGNGSYTAEITSDRAGSKSIAVGYAGQPMAGSGNQAAVFVAGAVDYSRSSFAVSGGEVYFTGTHTITVLLVDASDNPVSLSNNLRAQLEGTTTADLGTGEIGEFTETAPGVYQGLVSTSISGDKPITVALQGSPIIALGNTLARFTAGGVDITNANTYFTVTEGNEIVGIGQHTITAQLADVTGILIPGQAAYLSATASPSADVSISGFTETGTAGVYQATVTSTSAGAKTIRVFFAVSNTVVEAPAVGNSTAMFVAGAPAAAGSNISASPDRIRANGADTSTITVRLNDSFGNLVINAGDIVTMTSDGGLLSAVTDNHDGTYSATLTAGNSPAVATVSFAVGGTQVGASTAAVRFVDATPPPAPVVDPTNGSVVTGTAEPGSTVTVKDSDGDSLCTSIADGQGNFSCVPGPTPANGEELSVTATDSEGNTSPETDVVVDSITPEAPVVDPSNGSEVSGTAEPGSTVTVTGPDQTVLCTAVADPVTGAFSCVPTPTPRDGDQLSVTTTDESGNTSPPTVVIVDATPPDAPLVNPSNGDQISGSAEPGSTVRVRDDQGIELCNAMANATTGAFACTPNRALSDGEVVAVTATDAAANVSDATRITIDQTPPPPPLVDASNGSTIAGTSEPNSSIEVTDAGGNTLCTTTTGADGRFSCVPSPRPGDGDQVSVTATDRAGNRSDPTTITIVTTAPGAPVLNPTNGGILTGTAEPGSTVTVVDAGGKVLCTAVVAASGNFTCTLNPVAKDGAVLSATATSQAGNTSSPATVTVVGPRVVLEWVEGKAGTKQIARGHNFTPGQIVDGALFSKEVSLGVRMADENGEVSFSFTASTNLGLGKHTVRLTEASGVSASANFTLTKGKGDGMLPITGTDALVLGGIGLVVLLLGGLGVVLARRRKNE